MIPCRKTLRIRVDTVFKCWKEIPLADVARGIYLWSHGAQVSILEQIVNLPHKAAIKLWQKLRACYSSWLNRNPIVIGGNDLNYVVQIDESHIPSQTTSEYLLVISISLFECVKLTLSLPSRYPLVTLVSHWFPVFVTGPSFSSFGETSPNFYIFNNDFFISFKSKHSYTTIK